MDGHERDDVRKYRDEVFLPRMAKFESRMAHYKLEDGEMKAVEPTLAPGETKIIALFQVE